MGKLMQSALLMLSMSSTFAVADGITQHQKDAIRESYEKSILGARGNITTLQPDVALYRRLFPAPNKIDVRELPPADPIPWARLFKGPQRMSLRRTLDLVAAGSGYDVFYDPQVNQDRLVSLNTQPNSLKDIAEYLTRVGGAQITLLPESRSILVMQQTRIDQ